MIELSSIEHNLLLGLSRRFSHCISMLIPIKNSVACLLQRFHLRSDLHLDNPL